MNPVTRMSSAITLLFCLGGCEPDRSSNTRFRISLAEAPTTLDPIRASMAEASIVINNVYDTLYRQALFGQPNQFVPNLAAQLPVFSADGKKVRIRLRSDAYFQDSAIFPGGKGRQVLAHDVIYSMKRLLAPDNLSDGAWLWGEHIVGTRQWIAAGAKMDANLAGLRALAANELEIELTQPIGNLTSNLSNAYSAVVPHEAVETLGWDLSKAAVGSGPYMLVSFDGARALLRRNPTFRRETMSLLNEGYIAKEHALFGLAALQGRPIPMVDEVEILFGLDAIARYRGFSNNRLDFVAASADSKLRYFSQLAPLVLNAQWQSKANFQSFQEYGAVFVSFNMLDPEFGSHSDPQINAKHHALRCAIAEGYNWHERTEKVFGGAGMTFRGVIPPSVPGFERKNASPIFDPENAKRRLAAVGYVPNKMPTLTLGSTGGRAQRQSFELFRAQMMDIGFSSDQIQQRLFPSFGAYMTAVNRGEVMLMDMGWQMNVLDAEDFLQLYYGPFKAPQVNNASYQNARFDENFERIRALPPGPERLRIMQAMNQQLIDDCAVISGMTRQSVHLWRKPWIVWSQNLSGMLRFTARG
jgi:oligopeptide transport system substrate-binding protein